jgi:hypothetical protein
MSAIPLLHYYVKGIMLRGNVSKGELDIDVSEGGLDSDMSEQASKKSKEDKDTASRSEKDLARQELFVEDERT